MPKSVSADEFTACAEIRKRLRIWRRPDEIPRRCRIWFRSQSIQIRNRLRIWSRLTRSQIRKRIRIWTRQRCRMKSASACRFARRSDRRGGVPNLDTTGSSRAPASDRGLSQAVLLELGPAEADPPPERLFSSRRARRYSSTSASISASVHSVTGFSDRGRGSGS